MKIHHILIEILSVGLIAGAVFLSTKYFKFKTLRTGFSEEENVAWIVGIPSAVYVVARIFSLISDQISSLSSRYLGNKIGSLLYWGFFFSSFWILWFQCNQFEVCSVGLATALDDLLGDLPQTIVNLSKADVMRASQFGYRFAILIAACFVILLVIERLLYLPVAIIRWFTSKKVVEPSE